MAEHNERGLKAEELSAEYLCSAGFRILDRNWKYYQKEIDIIAEKDGEIVIVEVKSCMAETMASADDLVSKGKMRFIVDAAEAYLSRYNIEKETRFDVLIVRFSGEGAVIEHVERAFIPGVNW